MSFYMMSLHQKSNFFLSVKGRAKPDIIASNQLKYLKKKSKCCPTSDWQLLKHKLNKFPIAAYGKIMQIRI